MQRGCKKTDEGRSPRYGLGVRRAMVGRRANGSQKPSPWWGRCPEGADEGALAARWSGAGRTATQAFPLPQRGRMRTVFPPQKQKPRFAYLTKRETCCIIKPQQGRSLQRSASVLVKNNRHGDKRGRLFFYALDGYVLDLVEQLGDHTDKLCERSDQIVQLVHSHHPLQGKITHHFPCGGKPPKEHPCCLSSL